MLSAFRRSTATLPRTAASAVHPRTITVGRNAAVNCTKSRSTTLLQQRLSTPSVIGARSFSQSSFFRDAGAAAVAANDDGVLPAKDVPLTTFAELGQRELVHPNVVRSLKRMGLDTMTEVQSATISQALQGSDLIAQAKTGTGKTLGFLIPVLQNMISQDPSLASRSNVRRQPRTTADDIRAIIISPTRELAEQIAVEARRLVDGTNVIVQTAVGGTQKSSALRAMQREGSHILVGTPGRIKDIFSDKYSGVSAPGLDALVFDEADRLLDQGFWPEIEEILELLPGPEQKDRQTLMFSATVPRDVVNLVKTALKPDFQFVKTVRDDEEPTHTRVPQKLVRVNGLENYAPALTEIITKEIQKTKDDPSVRPFKAIVYFNSTAEVTCMTSILRNLPTVESLDKAAAAPTEAVDSFSNRRFGGRSRHPFGSTRIFEIHAKLSQSQRTRAAENFRLCNSGILFSSDVTARGMDFPNVTHVIQIGIPGSKETYIHRIGRTARAGKEGEGWLLTANFESGELGRRLPDLPLKPLEPGVLTTADIDMTREAQIPASAATILRQVAEAVKLVAFEDKEKVYTAMLGVYQWFPRKQNLIAAMNDLSRFGFGMPDPPRIGPGLVQKLGLGRIAGINSRSGGGDFRRGSRDDRDSSDRDPFSDRGGRGGYNSSSGRGGREHFGERRRGGGGGGGRDDHVGGRDNRRGGSDFGDRRGGGSSGSRFGDRGGRGGEGRGRGGRDNGDEGGFSERRLSFGGGERRDRY